MTSPKLIEIKIPKAVLFLTQAEYCRALKRGKAIKRRRSFDERNNVERKSHE